MTPMVLARLILSTMLLTPIEVLLHLRSDNSSKEMTVTENRAIDDIDDLQLQQKQTKADDDMQSTRMFLGATITTGTTTC